MTNIIPVRGQTERDIAAIVDKLRAAEPDEVMVVYLKAGDVHTLSTGTFSRMRTLGALEMLKYEILAGSES